MGNPFNLSNLIVDLYIPQYKTYSGNYHECFKSHVSPWMIHGTSDLYVSDE